MVRKKVRPQHASVLKAEVEDAPPQNEPFRVEDSPVREHSPGVHSPGQNALFPLPDDDSPPGQQQVDGGGDALSAIGMVDIDDDYDGTPPPRDTSRATSTPRQFRCERCEKDFRSRRALQRHLLLHTNVRKYVCPLCKSAFSRSDHLNTHLKIHKKRGRCPAVRPRLALQTITLSEARAQSLQSLYIHTSNPSQGSSATVACTKCSAKFSSSRDLVEHVQSEHGTQLQHGGAAVPRRDAQRAPSSERGGDGHSPLACALCGHSFDGVAQLQAHTLDKHLPRQPSGAHDRSDESIRAGSAASNGGGGRQGGNEQSAAGSGPSASALVGCDICGATVLRGEPFVQHTAQHLAQTEQTLCCSRCGEGGRGGSFTSRDQLADHVASKHVLRMLQCNLCYQLFDTMQNIMRHFSASHAVTHSRCRCAGCNALFDDPVKFKQHVLAVHIRPEHRTAPGVPYHGGELERALRGAAAASAARTGPGAVHPQQRVAVRPPPSAAQHVVFCTFCGMSFEHELLLTEHVQMAHGIHGAQSRAAAAQTYFPPAAVASAGPFTTPALRAALFSQAGVPPHQQLSGQQRQQLYPGGELAAHRRRMHERDLQMKHRHAQSSSGAGGRAVPPTCNICDRKFEDADALAAHKLATHGKTLAQTPKPPASGEGADARLHDNSESSAAQSSSAAVVGAAEKPIKAELVDNEDGAHNEVGIQRASRDSGRASAGAAGDRSASVLSSNNDKTSPGGEQRANGRPASTVGSGSPPPPLHPLPPSQLQGGQLTRGKCFLFSPPDEYADETKCYLCSLTLDSHQELQSHLVTHSFAGRAELRCYLCGALFVLAAPLLRHMHAQHAPAPGVATNMPYACNECDTAFYFPAQLDNHAAWHRRWRRSTSVLSGAQMRAERPSRSPATIRRSPSSQQQQLEQHVLSGQADADGTLNSSQERSAASPANADQQPDSTVSNHTAASDNEHDNGEPAMMHDLGDAQPQPHDDEQLDAAGRLRVKRAAADLDWKGATEYEERERDKAAKRKAVLRVRPDADGRYRCPHCGKSFASLAGVQGHSHVHMKHVKAFGCPECGKAFASPVKLSVHRRQHRLAGDAARPYPCHVCGRRFSRRDNLKVHARLHMSAQQAAACGVGAPSMVVGGSIDLDAFGIDNGLDEPNDPMEQQPEFLLDAVQPNGAL